MKRIVALAVLLAASLGAVTPVIAHDAPICLQTDRIDRTTVVNPQEILFRMKGGQTYSSHLSTPCVGLRFNGFVYQTSFMEVCGGSQSIRVLNTGEVCLLGKFEPVTPGHQAPAHS